MKKINLNSTNKKLVLIVLWMLIVVSLYLLYLYLNKFSEDEIGNNDTIVPVTYYALDFNYPTSWEKESVSYDEGDIDHDIYRLISENDDFEIEIEHKVINSYQNESGSSFYPSEAYTSNYYENDFELISEMSGRSLLVSTTGAAKPNSDGILEATGIVIGEPNYVYQKYEGGLSLVISAIIDTGISVPVGYKGVVISYSFRTQGAIDNWSEYKNVLKDVVQSIERN